MLASIIANLQNQPQPAAGFQWQSQSSAGPGDRSDRDTGQRWAGYDLVDLTAAMATFQEIPAEHPGARAARRQRWIGEVLPGIKAAREKREAASFLMGANLADAAVREELEEATSRVREEFAAAGRAREEVEAARRLPLLDKLSLEQLIKIVDEVRGSRGNEKRAVAAATTPLPQARGDYAQDRGSNSLGLFVGGLVVGGILVGMALSKRPPQRRRR